MLQKVFLSKLKTVESSSPYHIIDKEKLDLLHEVRHNVLSHL